MNTYGSILPGAARIARIPVLSREAKKRLAWMDWYRQHGKNARLTCRHFGISPSVFYRWKDRYDPRRLQTIEDRSHRPQHVRVPMTELRLVLRIKALREQYPRWGKDKLVVLLRREGWEVSTSMVGRTLTRLKARGLLVEPRRRYTKHRGLMLRRPHAAPKPWDLVPHAPGDLVEVDTVSVTILPGIRRHQFSARDVVSKWDVAETSTSKTSRAAARLLDALQDRMPFQIRALQIDGGSEFKAVFEQECQRRGLVLYVLPPRSPRLNGCVERSQRTWRDEFYALTSVSPDSVAVHRRQLQGWERTYNTIRPHQGLRYLTPQEFVVQWKHEHPEAPINLQQVSCIT